MLQNILKMAFRNMKKNMLHTITNITGLTIGIAACLIVWFYARYELNYDNFHKDIGNLYRVAHEYYQNGKLGINSAMTFPSLGMEMKREYPEIEDYTRLYPFRDIFIKYNDVTFFEENIYAADSNFFDFFDFTFLKGDPETVLDDPNHVLLSESTAKKYFGEEDPMDKTLSVFGNVSFIVKGIFKDYPKNSHFQFNIIISQIRLRQFSIGFENSKWNINCYTFLKLLPNANIPELENKFPVFTEEYRKEHIYDEYHELKLKLQPVRDIHLNSNLQHEIKFNSSHYYVYFVIMLAILLFCIASINFINLLTTSSIHRVKEIGIQKTIGSNRLQLIKQYITEAFILNLVSLILAILIVFIASNFLNNFFSKSALSLKGIDYKTILAIIGIVFTGTFITGLYPALFLTSFSPVMTLRDLNFSSGKGINVRKILLTIQYVACIALIGGTAVIYKQSWFFRKQDTGFNKEQMLVIKTPQFSTGGQDLLSNVSAFKSEVLEHANVMNLTCSSTIPGKTTRGYCYNCMQGPKCPEGYTETFYIYNTDENFIETYGLELLAGRNFTSNYEEEVNNIIIDETSLKSLYYETPEEAVNDVCKWWDDERTIIGVVKNFHHESFKVNLKPTIFYCTPFSSFFTLKLKTADIRHTIDFINEKWETHFPGNPINYFFLDVFYDKQYFEEDRLGKLIFALAFLSFFIACLGLFSLISFSIIQNTKRISIQKVIGANFINILLLVAREYIFALIISSCLALPIAYYFLNRWLSNYPYRINIGWWYFVIPIALVTLISYITINFEVSKVNRKNPAEALNRE